MTLSRLSERLRDVLTGELPGADAHRIAWPDHLPRRGPDEVLDDYRDAAVMVLLFPRDGQVLIPLVERPTTMPHHPGQIACPGGRLEPGEDGATAALRELEEELGVPPGDVELLGELSTIWIPVSGFRVQPFVGVARNEPTWIPDGREVQQLLFAELSDLARRGPTGLYRRHRDGMDFEAPAYEVGARLVWGATALLLAELGEIWKRLPLEDQ